MRMSPPTSLGLTRLRRISNLGAVASPKAQALIRTFAHIWRTHSFRFH
ncbi:hypothetical protein RSAG8_04580, partial [Rhizoctonia solani AG-8 WAC10335]